MTLSVDPDAAPSDQLRAGIVQMVEQAGLPQNVIECYERELNEVPDSTFADWPELQATLSQVELAERMRPIKRDLAQRCATKDDLGSFDVDSLDENEGAVLKEAALRQIETRLIRAGTPEHAAACVVDDVRALSTEEFFELNSEPPREIERRFAQVARACR